MSENAPPADNAPAKPAKKRIRDLPRHRLIAIAIVGGILLLGSIIAGSWYYLYSRSHESTDDAFIAGHIIRVAGRVPGHVKTVNVIDNQFVEKGDVLAELDPSDFQARLASAKAALSSAEHNLAISEIAVELARTNTQASLKDAEAGVAHAEAAVATANTRIASAKSSVRKTQDQVAVAKAAVAQAEADAASAEARAARDQADLTRAQELAKSGSFTQQQLDHAVATAQVSDAELAAVRQAVAGAKTKVASAESDVIVAQDALAQSESQLNEAKATHAQSQAQLAAAQTGPQQVATAEAKRDAARAARDQAAAAVRLAQLDLSYTRITAPAAGRVTSKIVEPGNYIQPGQTLLALVPEDLWVVANFKETQLTSMQPGQAVRITVDAYNAVFRGHIDSIQMGTGAVFSLLPPENATGNYIKVVQRVPVKIVFDEPIDFNQYHLAPGMSVVPVVDTASQPIRPPTPPAAPPEPTPSSPKGAAEPQ